MGSRLKKIKNKQFYAYVAGFLDGDGCITIRFEKSKTNKLSYRARVRVSFTQHKSKREVLDLMYKRIGSGKVTEYKHNNMAEYVIYDQKVIDNLLNELEAYVFVKRKHLQIAKELLKLKKEKSYTKQSLKKMLQLRKKMAALNNYSKKFFSLTP